MKKDNKTKKEKKASSPENVKSKKLDFSTYTIIFLIGSIIGFIYEQILYYLFESAVIKRGFLYGPYLPVYGFGAVLIVYFLKKYKNSPLLVFFLSMLLTGIVEYVTGFLMFKVYHRVWWDYTGLLLNIDGYVCLRSVLTFAIGGLILIYIIEPLICKLCEKVNKNAYFCLSLFIITIFIADFIFTIIYKNKIF